MQQLQIPNQQLKHFTPKPINTCQTRDQHCGMQGSDQKIVGGQGWEGRVTQLCNDEKWERGCTQFLKRGERGGGGGGVTRSSN